MTGMQEHMLLHTRHFSCVLIYIIYTFRAAMCPSSGELLYQCDTWFMSPCVDDCLVCRSICSYIPDFFCMLISILFTFRAAMCPSSGELLYQCDTWFMSLCVDVSQVGYLQRCLFWLTYLARCSPHYLVCFICWHVVRIGNKPTSITVATQKTMNFHI